jgi:acyl dehydratase
MPPDPQEIINAAVRAWIGRTTDLMPVPDIISASDVRRYSKVTGEQNPLWTDDEVARSAGYSGRVVPPMLLIELVWRVQNSAGRLTDRVPLPENYVDTRNLENEIEWFLPAYIGDQIQIRHRLRDISARKTRRGLGVYLTRETDYIRADGALLARATQTVVRFPRATMEQS